MAVTEAQRASKAQLEPIEIAKFWKSARDRKRSIVLTLKEYEGHTFLDCRMFDTNSDGQSVPTNKGITVGMARLEQFAEAVQKALGRARALGLVDEKAEA